MLKTVLVVAMALAPMGAAAAECRLGKAIYTQPGTEWELHFTPVPQGSVANMTGAFSIAVPGTDKVLAGGVFQPNGYSSSLGVLELDCPEDGLDDRTECTLWQGIVYAGDDDGIVVLPDSEEATAPRQVLLPQFAANIWYSTLREHFIEAPMPLDVFTYSGCAT